MTGNTLDYRHPKDFNQKLLWLARYWQHSLIVQCTDKLAVRDYVISCGLSHILNEVFCVYTKADEILLENLPDKFVLKANNGGGGEQIMFIENKYVADINYIRKVVNRWFINKYGAQTSEFQYSYIIPKVFAERFIESSKSKKLEIQFFCFNGEPRHILVRSDLGQIIKKGGG